MIIEIIIIVIIIIYIFYKYFTTDARIHKIYGKVAKNDKELQSYKEQKEKVALHDACNKLLSLFND